MHAEPELAGGRDHRVEFVERPHAPSRRVVRVLEGQHGRPLIRDLRARLRSDAHLLRSQAAAVPSKPERHEAGMRRCAAVLVDHDMRGLLGDEDVAGSTVQLHGDLVGHRRRRDEDRRLLAQQRRDARLQLVDAGILALLLVPDRSLGDGTSHPLGRSRSGIGAEVDHGAHATVRTWIWSFSRAHSPSLESRPTVRGKSGNGRRAALPRTTT